ncbi:uncharacterized protein LOC110844460 isoform X2 [Folsomia candida]|uniref:uncharacterized protein LOC110844460 isoform X2 n=1 Tax=Folsomia candida TaxID=158441 RepID=UPI000B908D7F|nr:uncharacterized protein LOC110844460 isoform X2 [Folsomia candida]
MTSSREARFIQSSINGIVFYSKSDISSFVSQYGDCPRRFRDILTLLHSDLQINNSNLKLHWDSAKANFTANPDHYKNSLKRKDGRNFYDECHIAIILYTLGSLYHHLNQDCRNSCGGGKTLKKIPNLSIFLLIRYVMEHKTPSTEPSFGQFTSTTVESGMAQMFAGTQGATFFVIVNSSSVRTKFIPMQSHSQYPSENEVLLSPFQTYKVRNVEKMPGDNYYVYLTI